MSINRVVLIGRLARESEARQTNQGETVVDFTLAVDKRPRRGEDQEPNWFRISAFGKTAEYVTTYLGKGRLVAVDGRLDHRKYQDRDGNNREAISIIADNVQGLDRPREDDVKPTQGRNPAGNGRGPKPTADDYDPFEDS
jgi:single-strand DNA-binding protein